MKDHGARRIAAPLAGIVCAALAAAHSAQAQCQYEVTAIIQGPPCPPSGTPAPLVGRGLNSHGHVAGSYMQCFATADEAFYWTPETGRVTLPRPDGVFSARATAINDNGLIAGGHGVSGVGWTGFVYNPNTRAFTYLQPLHPGVTATTVSSVNAINSAGIAVGSRIISKPGVTPAVSNAVIWDTNTGEVIDLGVGDGPNSMAVDGSDSSAAGGWSGTAYFTADARALLWIDDEVLQLEPLPGMLQNAVRAFNNRLDAVGTSGEGSLGTLHQFLWLDGTMSQFFPPAGYDLAGPADINDAKQIVGSMRVEGTSTFHPYLWQHETFHDLRDLIIAPPPNPVIGIGKVNDNGLMLGGTSNNRAVVLVPVDQPTGDLNHDCRVDVHDLQMLLDAWGPLPRAKRQTGSPADLNGDGVVDVSDLLILLANWSI